MALNGLVKQNAVYAGLTCGQTLLSPSPIPTISYSPAPSLPLPLPLPLDSPPSSSAAGCDGDGFLLPKLIGLSSRHWHAHTPSEVMMVALHICSAHQNKLAGMAWVYKEVTIKWIKCTVRAKSRTSLERAMRSSMKMAQARLFSTQTRPRVHPIVVSPRRLCQPNKRSVLTSLPATSAVKTIRMPAHA